MALTDTQIRKVKSREKSFKLADGKGLFLVVQPNGSKYWRFRYWFGGKEKLLKACSFVWKHTLEIHKVTGYSGSAFDGEIVQSKACKPSSVAKLE